MKWLRYISLLLPLLLLAAFAHGQNTTTLTQAGAPAGGCAFVLFDINSSTGDFYNCFAGAWHLVGPGAAGAAAFNTITSGTNIGQTLTVGNGSTLTFTGSGVVNANQCNGVACSTGTGTVTSVATTPPITGGTITNTGTIACATCATTTNGGALSATAPVTISAAGVIAATTHGGTARVQLSDNTGTSGNYAKYAVNGDVTDGGGVAVITTRTINTTAPITGGGDLSADRTMACATCATTTNGGALSGTSPVTVSAAGAIGCATCLTTSSTVPLNNVVSPTGAVATIANGDNAVTFSSATTTSGRIAMTLKEATASTSAGTPYEAEIATLAGSTATPLKVDNSLNGSQTLPALVVLPTWNTSGVATAFLINPTNTASGTGSLLLDAQIGGTSEFKVDKAGNATALLSLQTTATAPATTAGSAGAWTCVEGTAFTNVSGTAGIYCDSTLHEFGAKTNGASSAGMLVRAQPGAISSGAKTAAITTATLCASSAGACNGTGQYHIHWNFIEDGTACGTPGTGGVTFLLTWTDANGTSHSAVSLGMDDASAINAVSQTFHFQTSLGAAWASGDFNIDSNGSVIQYATGYTACSIGTGSYQLRATVTRLQ